MKTSFLVALAALCLSAGAWAQNVNPPFTPGGGGSSGITIDSTTITGGTNGGILFQAAGKVSENANFSYNPSADTSSGIPIFHGGIVPESDLPSFIQGYNNGDVYFTVKDPGYGYAVGIAASSTSNFDAFAVVAYGPMQTNASASDAYCNGNGCTAWGYASGSGADGMIAAADIYDYRAIGPFLSGGATATNFAAFYGAPGSCTGVTNCYGQYIGNVVGGTNNWAIKTGLGKTQWGDVELSTGVAFASLPTPTNGMEIYCSDCTITSGIDDTCAASGTGAWATRLNGVWRCNI